MCPIWLVYLQMHGQETVIVDDVYILMSYLLTPRHPSQASLIRSFGISCDLMARVYWSRTINITFQTFVRVLYEEWTHKSHIKESPLFDITIG